MRASTRSSFARMLHLVQRRLLWSGVHIECQSAQSLNSESACSWPLWHPHTNCNCNCFYCLVVQLEHLLQGRPVRPRRPGHATYTCHYLSLMSLYLPGLMHAAMSHCCTATAQLGGFPCGTQVLRIGACHMPTCAMSWAVPARRHDWASRVPPLCVPC